MRHVPATAAAAAAAAAATAPSGGPRNCKEGGMQLLPTANRTLSGRAFALSYASIPANGDFDGWSRSDCSMPLAAQSVAVVFWPEQ